MSPLRLSLFKVALLSSVLFPAAGQAAPILSLSAFDSGDPAKSGFTLSVDPNDLQGSYDTVFVEVTPLTADGLTGSTSATGKLLGTGTDTAFGTDLGGFVTFGSVSTVNLLSGTFASLGSNAISDSVFEYADIVSQPSSRGFTYSVRFADDGIEVASVSLTKSLAVVPLPSGALLLTSALVLGGGIGRRQS